ncbi:MAG: 16S rRNA (cytosine(1402)-N(4))-methyltransferase RsmH [Muribaculaceae bacterium]|nr:16S rRNA (cytosine(1402)-N(4))-methyltransferase RsmH [Muribaculaceae bacterium]
MPDKDLLPTQAGSTPDSISGTDATAGTQIYHVPALLPECMTALDIKPGGTYIDVTFGGGGHSREILSRLKPEGHLFGFDRDRDALANKPDDPRFTFVLSDYRYLENFLDYHGAQKVDGILADLGVSFHHFDTAERGFSFRSDAPLDMRMNRTGGKSAAELIADASKEELERIFREYTDLKRPGQIASAIVKSREDSPILTTHELWEAVRGALSPKSEKKDLSQVFQALRIEVNGELESIRKLLEASARVLKPGGRLAVITYHSIEDRLVKNFMRSGNTEGKIEQDIYGRVHTPWKLITRSPITPSEQEVEQNPRSRSAKLRVAELI